MLTSEIDGYLTYYDIDDFPIPGRAKNGAALAWDVRWMSGMAGSLFARHYRPVRIIVAMVARPAAPRVPLVFSHSGT